MVANVHTPNEQRWGSVVHVPGQVYRSWSFEETCIAQLELAMVMWGIICSAAALRGTRGLCFIDNTAAFMAVVKGRSNQPDLDKMASILQLAAYVWNI